MPRHRFRVMAIDEQAQRLLFFFGECLKSCHQPACVCAGSAGRFTQHRNGLLPRIIRIPILVWSGA
jgi:hypothetical protein